MDTIKLKAQTAKDLAEMARKKGIAGWHSMRKDQLVRALLKQARVQAERRGKAVAMKNGNGQAAAKPTNGHAVVVKAANGQANLTKATNGHASVAKASNGHAVAAGPHLASKPNRALRRLNKAKTQQALSKDLAIKSVAERNGHTKDRLVALVLDPYWLHVYWELTRSSVERARAAMGQHWHGARPVLRVHEVAADGTTNTARRMVRQVEIHGGVSNWYVNVENPPKSYQMDIGYLAPAGKFYAMARSNVVATPAVGDGRAFDRNWESVDRDSERIYALSGGTAAENGDGELREVLEEHLHRPLLPPPTPRLSLDFGDDGEAEGEGVNLQVDAELIVYGTTDPSARVTLRGEPVRLRPDGTFAVRFGLPDRRQVLPVVASSGDGSQQRTIVLAVERNTKVMEPVTRDVGD